VWKANECEKNREWPLYNMPEDMSMFRIYTIKCVKTVLEYIFVLYSSTFLIHIFHLGYNINRKFEYRNNLNNFVFQLQPAW